MLDATLKQSLLSDIRKANARMYNGTGDLLDRIDKALMAEQQAGHYGIHDDEIRMAREQGRHDYEAAIHQHFGV